MGFISITSVISGITAGLGILFGTLTYISFARNQKKGSEDKAPKRK